MSASYLFDNAALLPRVSVAHGCTAEEFARFFRSPEAERAQREVAEIPSVRATRSIAARMGARLPTSGIQR